jgi:hypothetical protein
MFLPQPLGTISDDEARIRELERLAVELVRRIAILEASAGRNAQVTNLVTSSPKTS